MKPVSLDKVTQLNPYERVQSKLKFHHLFPKPRKKGKCRCGCRKKVKPPRRVWATDECSQAASDYYMLIKGYQSFVRRQVYARDKGVCAHCGKRCGRKGWEADHILEVVYGGGGCGLDNYQTLCVDCHKVKTAELLSNLGRKHKK